jgi:sugar phosphate permease
MFTHFKDPTIGISTEVEIETDAKATETNNSPLTSAKIFLPTTFLLLLLIMSFRGFGRNLYDKFFVLFLVEDKLINEATAAFYLSLLTLIGLPGTLLGGIGGDRYGEKRILILAYMCATLGLTLVYLVQNPLLIPLALLVLAIGSNAAMPSINSLTAKVVPLKARGKAYGLTFLFPVAIGAIAPPIAATLIDISGFNLLFAVAISFFAMATLITFFINDSSNANT